MPVKFCKECNNMLYPMEDRTYLHETGERRMLYACRNCSHREVAEDLGVPVYRNVVTSNNRLQRGKFLQMYDVWLDPTLRRTRSTQCSQCGNREAVYFMGPVGRNDTAIVLYFVCTNCKHQWSTADEQN